eukprot:TRINITY_DN10057_c0_g3_i6.p1 TRINITY_DN10057_c0_g3~~TRINITY_DN10057_c0_g3_i6.p1  ORF type:complete len:397 (-),score=98.44 TRINITY_DN10057_c0_g3_i6:69-1259(-)
MSMHLADVGSSNAMKWAAQKREMLDRARKIKDDKKKEPDFLPMGEKNRPAKPIQPYGERPHTQQELNEARTSLRLLKAKMNKKALENTYDFENRNPAASLREPPEEVIPRDRIGGSQANFGGRRGEQVSLSNEVPIGRRQAKPQTAAAGASRPFVDEESYWEEPSLSQRGLKAQVDRNISNSLAVDERPAFVAKQPALSLKPNPSEEVELIECREGCGRCFNETAIEKHEKVCRKVFQSKRQPFDVAGMRKTEEQIQIEKSTKGKKTTAPAKEKPKEKNSEANGEKTKKSKWKLQSEAFRAILRAGEGGPVSKEDQKAMAAAMDSDLIRCDHCGRKFNEKAASRHIPFCANKSKMDKIKGGSQTTTPTPNNFATTGQRTAVPPSGAARGPAQSRKY